MDLESLIVFYFQKLKDYYVRYILTTTQHGQKPISQARFIVNIGSIII